MYSSWQTAPIALLLVACFACPLRADPIVEIVELKYLDAAEAVALFSPPDEPGEDRVQEMLAAAAVNFALDVMADVAAVRPPRRSRPLPIEGVSGGGPAPPVSPRTVQGERPATLAHLLPEGLEGPPTIAPRRNALIVKGTPAAMDEFREILAMLDTPAAMVRISLRLDEFFQSAVRSVLPEMHAWGWGGEAHAGGPASGQTMLGFGLSNSDLLLGAGRQDGLRRTMTEAQVTVTNAHPAIISVGEVRPWFAGEVWYDAWGRRHIEYFPYAIFTGLSLWVLPQIQSDDTVLMHLRPMLVEAGGKASAIGPGDVLRTTLVETVVRAHDGQPLVIGGLRRLADEQNQRWSTVETAQHKSTDSVITVTPHIIRTLQP